MKSYGENTIPRILYWMREDLLNAPEADVKEVHSQSIAGKPEYVTKEVENVTFETFLPSGAKDLADITEANLPWAEDHFLERVSGVPLNPPPSASWWPYAQKGHEEHTDEKEQFSHTYPERFWPKKAGQFVCEIKAEREEGYSHSPPGHQYAGCPAYGIRFDYGDLMDVVEQLHKNPATRQAYLPVWFPEDTGARQGQRVPCSLGYHFLIRNNQLNITYFIRSCDYMRHFRDDVYMAGRLAQWVQNQLVEREGPDDLPVPQGLTVGRLNMHIVSLHIFKGDVSLLERQHGR